MTQDDFYLKTEANAFFSRWKASSGAQYDGKLRNNKHSIFSILENNFKIEKTKVLEVGCFIGDLLHHLRENFDCEVSGVETSSLACDFSKTNFSLDIENSSFIKSSFFGINDNNKGVFDLIIFDDVLSWMGRSNILQVIAVSDWLLKHGGAIFIRDFSPAFSFCFENHHCKGEGVYNYKQANGHRQFLLQTGMYYEQYTKTYNDSCMQLVTTSRLDSRIWSDSLLVKTSKPLHPILDL